MNVTDRFLQYVSYGTNSDEKAKAAPPPRASWCWAPPLQRN